MSKLTVSQRKYNYMIEKYIENILEEMSPIGFKLFCKVLSPIENKIHWAREGTMDDKGLHYTVTKFLQSLLWGIPFLSFSKGREIVNKFEDFIWESQR